MRNTTIEALKCKLTDEETMAEGKLGALRLSEAAKTKQKIKDTTSELRQKMKEQEAEALQALHNFSTGTQTRDVETFERKVWATNQVETIRVDTGDRVRVRAMHPSERQQDLDDIPAPRNPGAEKLRKQAQKAEKKEKPAKLPKGKLATLGEIVADKAKKKARAAKAAGKTKPHVKSAPKGKKGPLTKKFEELAKPVKNPELERAAAELRHMDN